MTALRGSEVPNPLFDSAYAAYVAAQQGEGAIITDTSNEIEAAFEVMMGVPVADGPRVALKLVAIFDRYNPTEAGLPSIISDSFLFEAAQILREGLGA